MIITCFAFSAAGTRTVRYVRDLLRKAGHEAEACVPALHLVPESDLTGVTEIKESIASHFQTDDALICVGACGIAVRMIAPYLKSKLTDPAVIVMDEEMRFVIPLVGGHVGGANRLARFLSDETGAVCVVTTATDLHGVYAVDVWALDQHLYILEKDRIKSISSRLLEGKEVSFSPGPYEVEGELPEGVVRSETGDCGFVLGYGTPYPVTLHLIPQRDVIGIGCKKDTSYEHLLARVEDAMRQAGVRREMLCAIATIDRKAHEPAILRLTEAYGLPLEIYTAAQLEQVQGTFAASAFVKQTVGVDNVCERAALAAGGRLILPKMAGSGVTVAIARRETAIVFPKKDTFSL